MTGRRIAHELAVAVLVVLLGGLLGALFISGASWVTYRLLPLFERLAVVALCLSLLVLLPLAVPRRTRHLSSRAISAASYIFGATLWIDSFQLTAAIWGAGGLIVGFGFVSIALIPVSTGWRKRFGPWRGGLLEVAVILGAGVLPIAMLATAWKGWWAWLMELVALLVATFGCRALALHLSASAQGAEIDNLEAGSWRKAAGLDGSLDALAGRPKWRGVPPSLLKDLVTRIGSPEKAREFADICERHGITERIVNNLREYSNDPEWAFAVVSMALGVFAGTVSEQRKLSTAKLVLEFASLIKANNAAVWYWLALVTAQLGENQAAVYWADKFLSYRPDAGSSDLFERSAAAAMTRTAEEEKHIGELLGEPNMAGALEGAQEAMRLIKEACDEKA